MINYKTNKKGVLLGIWDFYFWMQNMLCVKYRMHGYTWGSNWGIQHKEIVSGDTSIFHKLLHL